MVPSRLALLLTLTFTLTLTTQDGAVESVVSRTEPQPRPWIVYTCGPMGAGKVTLTLTITVSVSVTLAQRS